MKQDNTKYTFLIKLSQVQDKSKLQKQISKILIYSKTNKVKKRML